MSRVNVDPFCLLTLPFLSPALLATSGGLDQAQDPSQPWSCAILAGEVEWPACTSADQKGLASTGSWMPQARPVGHLPTTLTTERGGRTPHP